MAITPAAVPYCSVAAARGEALLKVMAFGGSALLHAVALTTTCAALSSAPASSLAAMPDRVQVRTPVLPRLIYLAPRDAGFARGGGGGGNRQAGPIRRAEGVGRDRATLRTRQSVATTGTLAQDEVRPPAVLLDARPIASGNTFQAGLPTSGVTFGFSLGTGSSGGVGTGAGTGIGPGRGPGFGAGSGGGTGKGPYRPGGSKLAAGTRSRRATLYERGARATDSGRSVAAVGRHPIRRADGCSRRPDIGRQPR